MYQHRRRLHPHRRKAHLLSEKLRNRAVLRSWCVEAEIFDDSAEAKERIPLVPIEATMPPLAALRNSKGLRIQVLTFQTLANPV